jgi:hypothetical protein
VGGIVILGEFSFWTGYLSARNPTYVLKGSLFQEIHGYNDFINKGGQKDETAFSLLQDGVKVSLGPTFQTETGAQPTDCGYWEGGYLTRGGKVTVRAYAGKLEVGSVTFSIY